MAKYIQSGESLDYTATVDVKAGDPVVIGSYVGIAQADIAKGTKGAVAMEGVFAFNKATGAITAGTDLYYDASAKTVSATKSAVQAGYAAEDAAESDTTVKVKLRG